MDLAGIWASVSFPSQITGFCGAVYSGCSDPELGQACVRAWNDWFAEEWREPYADRFVGLGIVYLADADEAAAEIRRNAARGFRAVSLPEQPHRLGYPSLHSGWWDPVLAACAETGTVVVPARGQQRDDGHGPRRAAGRDRRHPLLVAVAGGVRRLAVVRRGAPLPRPAHRHERGRHRLGAAAGRPARLHPRLVGPRPGRLAVDRAHAHRGAAAQLLVLLASTTRRSGPSATASASTTSWSRSTTPTPTRPGPTPSAS